MCRLYGFRANEPTKVECTLVRAQNALLIQSQGDLRGMTHPDGWGIAVYEDGEPQLEKHATAAYEDLHFSTTAERAFARTVVAHIRDATVGTASPFNTHPFRFGRWVFAHNGTVRGFDRLEEELKSELIPELVPERRGSTDSEMAFLWLISKLSQAGVDLDKPDLDTDRGLALVVRSLARSVQELSQRSQRADPDKIERLNFLLTDGHAMVVTRWNNGLYYVERNGIHDCEVCGIPHVHHSPSNPYRAVVIASEPISHEPWQEVAQGQILVVEPTLGTRLETI
jgi:glutamine amidotransferase